MKRFQHAGWIVVLLVVGGLSSSGCRQGFMQATPRWTNVQNDQGDGGQKAPQEDDPYRVNLWPLVYKNFSAWSVLWPFLEKTENSFAVRPFFDLYRGKEGRILDVLFPLMRPPARS